MTAAIQGPAPDDADVVCIGCGCPTPAELIHDDHEPGCPRKGVPGADGSCWCALPCCPTCCTSCNPPPGAPPAPEGIDP